jgi:hypothetical protein
MANYVARVELLGDPDREVYNQLHARMLVGGLRQTIIGYGKGNKPVVVALPHATYNGNSEWQARAIREWISKEAAAIWTKVSKVFVAEINAANWGIS